MDLGRRQSGSRRKIGGVELGGGGGVGLGGRRWSGCRGRCGGAVDLGGAAAVERVEMK